MLVLFCGNIRRKLLKRHNNIYRTHRSTAPEMVQKVPEQYKPSGISYKKKVRPKWSFSREKRATLDGKGISNSVLYTKKWQSKIY